MAKGPETDDMAPLPAGDDDKFDGADTKRLLLFQSEDRLAGVGSLPFSPGRRRMIEPSVELFED